MKPLERITRATTSYQPEIKISPLIIEEANKINMSQSLNLSLEVTYSMPKYALKNGVMVKDTLISSEIMMELSRNPKLHEVISRIKSKQIIAHSQQ